MNNIIKILMERDGATFEEARELFKEAQLEFSERIEEGDMEGAEEIMMEYFGLEPDYIMDLMM